MKYVYNANTKTFRDKITNEIVEPTRKEILELLCHHANNHQIEPTEAHGIEHLLDVYNITMSDFKNKDNGFCYDWVPSNKEEC